MRFKGLQIEWIYGPHVWIFDRKGDYLFFHISLSLLCPSHTFRFELNLFNRRIITIQGWVL